MYSILFVFGNGWVKNHREYACPVFRVSNLSTNMFLDKLDENKNIDTVEIIHKNSTETVFKMCFFNDLDD